MKKHKPPANKRNVDDADATDELCIKDIRENLCNPPDPCSFLTRRFYI
jgi:hypothetical protein